MNKKLEKTADGSHTIYIPEIDEHYHSVNGAIQESLHVFVNAGLKRIDKSQIFVLEIGFGTGLNAYLSLLYSSTTNLRIQYSAVELYPVESGFIKDINFPRQLNENSLQFQKLHEAEWGTEQEITPYFSLTKLKCDFTDLNALRDKDIFDIIYYDAFAPDKQPAMWSQNIFDYLHKHTRTGGVLVTYCAKGAVRRMLQHAGYSVERLPGPIGKREMIRASKV